MADVVIELVDGPFEGGLLTANYSTYAVPQEIYVSTSEVVAPGTLIFTEEFYQTGDAVYRRTDTRRDAIGTAITYRFVERAGPK